jgi:hypothetical protein
MDQFIWLCPLIVGALGYLTYNQPLAARQILKILIGVTAGIFLVGLVYYFGESKFYRSSVKATDTTVYQNRKPDLSGTDTTYIELKLRESIIRRISTEIDKESDRNTSFMIWCYVSMGILLALLLFSQFSEKFRKPNGKSHNDSGSQGP